jgi:murein DD-endopeptidase MepM/ murein hydrolase activator NlpD
VIRRHGEKAEIAGKEGGALLKDLSGQLESRRRGIPVSLYFLLFITALFFSVVPPAYAEKNLRIGTLPGVVKQGDVCLLRASGPASLTSVYGEFQGERFPMASGVQKGTYEGLLGIDLNIRPAAYEIKVLATDGESKVYRSDLSLKVKKADFKTQRLSLPSPMVDLDAETLERVDREDKRLKALFQGFREERLWGGPFVRPVPGEITTGFGLRRIINGQPKNPHTGVDLRGAKGTPVSACNGGVVALVDDLFFSGKSIILDHGWGIYSMYFHLSETLVGEGDRVRTGAILGRVGSTGRSTRSHLHWAIRINGARVDPLSLVKLSEHLREENH